MTTVTLTGSGSWTIPTNVFAVTAECIGGGGGSAYVSSGGNYPIGGPGGAGGAYARKLFKNLTPGATISYSVGAGGTGGNSSNGYAGDGGTSWFSSNDSSGCVATGGQGGVDSASMPVGPGIGSFAGCYGDVIFRGGSGSASTLSTSGGYSGAGGGGAGTGGAGGDAPTTPTPGAGTAPGGNGGAGYTGANGGNNGNAYGGGASGAGAGAFTSQNGMVGGIGTIILTYAIATVEAVSETATGTGAVTVRNVVSASPTAADTVAVGNVVPDQFSATEAVQVLIEPATSDPWEVDDEAGSGLAVTVSDSLTLSEMDPALGLAVSESPALDDSPTNTLLTFESEQISALDLGAVVFGVSDTSTSSDSAYKQVGINTPSSDSASGSENALVGQGIQSSDTSTATEALTLVIRASETAIAADLGTTQVIKYASDVFTGGELADTELFFGAADQFSVSESAQIGFPIIGSDTATMAASLVSVGVLPSDTANFVDSANWRPKRLVGDRVYYVGVENRAYVVPEE